MSGPEKAASSVTITHATGLHARPAVTFTKLAKTFTGTDIRIRGSADAAWTDAKSIVKVMKLKLRSGTILEIEAEGSDAETALKALKGLVERDFDEGEVG